MQIIFLPEDTSPDGEIWSELPSPEKLKGKILFKGKGNASKGEEPEESEDEDMVELDDGQGGGGGAADGDGKKKKKKGKRKKDRKAKMFEGQHRGAKKDKELAKDAKRKQQETGASKHDSERWVRIIYLCAVKFKSFTSPGPAYEMASYSESKARKLCSTQRLAFVEYNRKQLARIYPWGGRFDSSNLDPGLAWATGCQLVAFNFQVAAPRAALLHDHGAAASCRHHLPCSGDSYTPLHCALLGGGEALSHSRGSLLKIRSRADGWSSPPLRRRETFLCGSTGAASP